MFNDELPDGSSGPTGKAHQKGVIGFDSATNTGFYMLHSTPGWPNMPNTTNNFTSDIYGQHFFCISINNTQLETLGKHLYVTRPNIYWDSFTDTFTTTYTYFNMIHKL